MESYLPGFERSIYGDQLALTKWRFIRKQERFADAAALIDQISRDVRVATDL